MEKVTINPKATYWFSFIFLAFAAIWTSENFLLENTVGDNGLLAKLFPGISEKLSGFDPGTQKELIGQLKWRWLLLAGLGWYLFHFQAPATKILSGERQLWLVRLLMVIQMLYLPDLAKELAFRASWVEMYQPLPQWKWLVPTFLPYFVHQWLILALFALGAFSVLKKWPVSSPFWLLVIGFTILVWMILLVQLFGFGKIDHTYSSLFTGMIGLWFWLVLSRFFPSEQIWGFRLFQAFIWGCYFFSGLEKLLFSGPDWVSDSHFQQLIIQHPTHLGRFIGSIPLACYFFLVFGIGFQLLSILQWRFPIWGYVNSIGAVIFHLGTYFVFNVGGWQSPWILMAIFLLPDWEQTKKAPKGA